MRGHPDVLRPCSVSQKGQTSTSFSSAFMFCHRKGKVKLASDTLQKCFVPQKGKGLMTKRRQRETLILKAICTSTQGYILHVPG